MQMVKNPNQRLGGGASGVQPVYAAPVESASYGGGTIGQMVVPPGAIGGTPQNPIYGPNGPGSNADGTGYLAGWGPDGQIPGYWNDPLDWHGGNQQVGGGNHQQINPNPPTAAAVGALPPYATGAPPSVTGQGTPWGAPNPQSQWSPLPGVAPPGYMADPTGSAAYQAKTANLPGAGPVTDGSQYNGQSTTNANAQQFQYDQVQEFSDMAYDQSMRYLNPQMEQQQRQLDQQLINQGIDPKSEYGQFMSDQLARQQSDLTSRAAFDALNYGSDLQQQMFEQDAFRTSQASTMQMAEWAQELGFSQEDTRRMLGELNYSMGQDQLSEAAAQRNTNFALGMNQLGMDRYQSDLQYNLGMGDLDLRRAQQSFNEMMGFEDLNYREYMAQEDKRRYDVGQILSMLNPSTTVPGSTLPPGYNGQVQNPYDYYSRGISNAYDRIRGG